MLEKKTGSWVVYMVLCADGSYYIGCSNDLKKRIKVHNSGKGAKYTRSRTPVNLVYTEKCSTRSESLKREHALKQLTRQQKTDLFKKNNS